MQQIYVHLTDQYYGKFASSGFVVEVAKKLRMLALRLFMNIRE
jgi:hypothetical protein